MIYEWDEQKNANNRRKHGVDFSLVEQLDWDSTMIEPQYHEDELRYVTLAPIGHRVYTLIWTQRFDKIRVISLRKANKREARDYAQNNISNS